MAYIGSSAAVTPVAFSGVNAQSFNGDGSTVAFTLNRPVSSVAAIEVVVNNVQQSPYDGSYSVSNTTLTFSAAPSTGTGNIYVVYRDFPVGSITDPNAVAKTGDTMTGDLIVNASVGIGTSSPTNKLHAFSSSTTTTVAKFGANNYGNTGTTYVEIGTQYGDGGSRIGNINPSGNLGTLVFETMTGTSGVFAERARIDADGLKFNGDTAAANALDDYEEGTWTPVISPLGTGTYSSWGAYTKIGNLVHIEGKVTVASNNGSGVLTISGLPFTGVNNGDSNARPSAYPEGDYQNINNAINSRAHFRLNGDSMVGVANNGSGSTVYFDSTSVPGSFEFNFSVSYRSV